MWRRSFVVLGLAYAMAACGLGLAGDESRDRFTPPANAPPAATTTTSQGSPSVPLSPPTTTPTPTTPTPTTSSPPPSDAGAPDSWRPIVTPDAGTTTGNPSDPATVRDFCLKCAACVASDPGFTDDFCDPHHAPAGYDVEGCATKPTVPKQVTKGTLAGWTCAQFDDAL